MRAIPHLAVEFLTAHEGLRLHPYRDATGVQTIGYGHTGAAARRGRPIDQDQAEALLRDDLEVAAGRLEDVLRPAVIESLTEQRYAALLSFVFNLGANPKWTIWRRLNAGELTEVPREMTRFVNAAGRKIPGLVARRVAEIRLWRGELVQAPASGRQDGAP